MFDLLIFLGQSNMQGQTDRLSENNIVKGAYEYKLLTDSLEPLKNPVGENITTEYKLGYDYYCDPYKWSEDHLIGMSAEGKTNMVPSFVRNYIKETNKDVIAIHCAKGATILDDYKEDKPIYNAIIKKIESGIKKIGKDNIDKIYCVFLQGESDALLGTTKNDYINKLIEYKNNLKKHINLDKFAIIKVGKFANDKRDDEIFNAQEEIVNIDSDFILISRITSFLFSDNKYQNPNALYHFSATAQELIGADAGTTLGIYRNNK